MIISKQKLKKVTPTILFYLISILVIVISNIFVAGDMCDPELGTYLLIFILPLTSFILLLINLLKTLKGDKENKIVVIIHLTVILIIVSWIVIEIFIVEK